MRSTRVILIGGPSSVGKSTLANALAIELGWQWTSTDSLARHPGSPWRSRAPDAAQHVADHYRSLSVEELVADVRPHHERMWPGIKGLASAHASDPAAYRLIIEGSAIWPDPAATIGVDGIEAIWLTADNTLLRDRIYAASNYANLDGEQRTLVDKFLGKWARHNELMMVDVHKRNLASLDVSSAPSTDDLMAQCFEMIGR